MLVHWLNHRQKLAIKDAFRGTFFGEIDVILIKIITFTKMILKDYVSSRNPEQYLVKLSKTHENQRTQSYGNGN